MTRWPGTGNTETEVRGRPARAHGAELRVRPPARRVRLGTLVGGLFIVFVCALVFLVAWNQVGGGSAVVVLRDIPAGHVLVAGDLGVASLRGSGQTSLVSGADLQSELGRPAAVDLVAGQPLVRADVGAAPAAAAGTAVLGLALQPGQYPPALAAGDTVLILDTGGYTAALSTPAPGAAVAPVAPAVGTVLRVDQGSGGSGPVPQQTVVTVRVPVRVAASVAASAAAGRATLALVPAGG